MTIRGDSENTHNTHGVLNEGGVVDGNLRDTTAVSERRHLARAVSSAHAYSLGEDLLQLGRRSARYQRPYQSQRVIVEVRLCTPRQ